jgi:hypothetical protein
MKDVFKNLIGQLSWMTGLLFIAQAAVQPVATADSVEDIVANLSDAKQAGELLNPRCDASASSLNKGSLVHSTEDGSLKYEALDTADRAS